MTRPFATGRWAVMTATAVLAPLPVCSQNVAELSEAPPAAGALPIQAQLDALRRLVTTQQSRLEKQAQRLAAQTGQLEEQQRRIDAQSAAIDTLRAQVGRDAPASGNSVAATGTRASSLGGDGHDRGTTGSIASQETTTTYDISQFKGGIPIPGTNSALRFGGFVKTNWVESFNGLGSQDRFSTGTIPTSGAAGGDAEAVLTAEQSRFSVELRDDTNVGQLRAFLEGDFAGTGNSFRLRHAFGQFRDVMVGETWSTFMDTRAAPEDLDFEGINGRIDVRQPELRWFPKIGTGWNLELALEDPAPDVTGGAGVSQVPDFVASIRTAAPQIFFSQSWSLKSSLIVRSVRARWNVDPNVKRSAIGWGLSISGTRDFDRWDPKDNLAIQINYGDGYGRYVNDLGTIGGQDAVFDDSTGEMRTLKVLASYASFQKWWGDGLRSNFIMSQVNVDNASFQPGDAYDKTLQLSGNLIWSPVERVDLGAEAIWGRRVDKDGALGTASQVQFSARYRF